MKSCQSNLCHVLIGTGVAVHKKIWKINACILYTAKHQLPHCRVVFEAAHNIQSYFAKKDEIWIILQLE